MLAGIAVPGRTRSCVLEYRSIVLLSSRFAARIGPGFAPLGGERARVTKRHEPCRWSTKKMQYIVKQTHASSNNQLLQVLHINTCCSSRARSDGTRFLMQPTAGGPIVTANPTRRLTRTSTPKQSNCAQNLRTARFWSDSDTRSFMTPDQILYKKPAQNSSSTRPRHPA